MTDTLPADLQAFLLTEMTEWQSPAGRFSRVKFAGREFPVIRATAWTDTL
jgi:hypothetical protein